MMVKALKNITEEESYKELVSSYSL